MKIIHSLLIALTMGSITFPAGAQDDAPEIPEQRIYDVEIIIFRNDSVPKGREINLPTPSASRTENTIALAQLENPEVAEDTGFSLLAGEEMRLMDSAQKISDSSRYSLLLHTGWRQPGLESGKTIPVWIQGGRVFSNRYSSIDQFSAIQSSEDSGISQTPRYGLYELEGLIEITLSRYLHTRADLVLRKPADPVSLMQQQLDPDLTEEELERLEGGSLLNYGLNEQRRMRSKKLHYLDHPQFGMLVLITPYEAPEPVDQPAEGDSAVTPEESAVTGDLLPDPGAG